MHFRREKSDCASRPKSGFEHKEKETSSEGGIRERGGKETNILRLTVTPFLGAAMGQKGSGIYSSEKGKALFTPRGERAAGPKGGLRKEKNRHGPLQRRRDVGGSLLDLADP